jgi:hypothetical protein
MKLQGAVDKRSKLQSASTIPGYYQVGSLFASFDEVPHRWTLDGYGIVLRSMWGSAGRACKGWRDR